MGFILKAFCRLQQGRFNPVTQKVDTTANITIDSAMTAEDKALVKANAMSLTVFTDVASKTEALKALETASKSLHFAGVVSDEKKARNEQVSFSVSRRDKTVSVTPEQVADLLA